MNRSLNRSRLLTLTGWLFCVGAFALTAAPARASFVFSTSYTFSALDNNANSDGAEPAASFIVGGDGNFYGTTQSGGASGDGTVFTLTAAGDLTTLATFTNTNGASPEGALVEGSDGNFYGTTYQGGAHATGTVFKMTPSGTLTTIHSFSALDGSGDNADGANPAAGLVQGGDGNFYGTTYDGGTAGYGTVYKITPSGTVTVIHAFTALNGSGTNADGADPLTALILGGDGNFYGTTAYGGTSGYGTIFQITASGTLTNLVDFDNANGSEPNAVLEGGDGNFYGTTTYGGASGFGTAFEMTPSGTLTTLMSFDGAAIGGNPEAGLIQGSDGNFYGTDDFGGTNGNGTVFELTATGTVTTLHSFAAPTSTEPYLNSDGAYPDAALVQTSDGSIYGTAHYGGTAGSGTIFQLTPVPAPVITSFSPAAGPVGSVVTMTGTNLGSAALGGVISVRFHNANATVYSVNAAGTQLTATVPSGAGTGPIVVTTLGGAATTATSFTVGPPPTITSFSPTSGPVGLSVTITGTHLTGTSSVVFKNASATKFSVNGGGTQITATVPTGAATGAITVTTPTGSATSSSAFTVTTVSPPTITSFTPIGGVVGTVVTVTGTNLTYTTGVRFHNATASTFSVNGAGTQLTVTVPSGAETGTFTVTTLGGSVTTTTPFTVGPPPTITSFSPTSGPVGLSVTITGTNLNGVTAVRFHNTNATTFSVNGGGTQITATVPMGAATGAITVTTPTGSVTSTSAFTVTTVSPPTITSFSPIGGVVGTVVTVTGTNLTYVTSVHFHNANASSYSSNGGGTQLTVTVPSGAETGTFTVTTLGGSVTTTTPFTVGPPPTITSFSPTSGPAGLSVTITGTNLTGATSVLFRSTSATTFSVNGGGTQITATVPMGAATGAITVTTPTGSVTSSSAFTVTATPGPPTIASFTPTSGPIGTVITVTGTNLNYPTGVRFHNANASSYSSNNAGTQLTATVPTGAGTGTFTVTTLGGSVKTTGTFTVTP